MQSQEVGLYIDGILVGCANSASLNVTREFLDAVCAATGAWRTRVPGLMDWSGSIDALLRVADGTDAATNVTMQTLFTRFVAGTDVLITFGALKDSVIGGDTHFRGRAFIGSLNQTVDYEGRPAWTVDYSGNGALVLVAGGPV